MEETVYSNVQAKSCSGSCTYSCNGTVWTKDTDTCSSGCSCDDHGNGINVGDSCQLGYDQPITNGCI